MLRFFSFDRPCVSFMIVIDTRDSFAQSLIVWAFSEVVKDCYQDSKLYISPCE